jgi:hypothetical protein
VTVFQLSLPNWEFSNFIIISKLDFSKHEVSPQMHPPGGFSSIDEK